MQRRSGLRRNKKIHRNRLHPQTNMGDWGFQSLIDQIDRLLENFKKRQRK